MALGIDNPFDNPGAWDVLEVAGVESPGLCKVDGWKRDFGWDVKKGKGVKGATLTLADYPPAEGSFTFQLWEAEHFERWAEFVDLFRYDRSKKPVKALDVWHPVLAAISVDSVVVKSISGFAHDGKGLYSVKVDMIEYWPPPKKDASSTADAAKNKADKKANTPGKTNDPIADAQQEQIKKLLGEAKKP